ncbi:hypothetical protein XENOCAPTIV_009289 [Xenoophorus captivus]|uniref:Uncharacterized protein n=1 Tax=Xenoophorus captivus TaxID=1517983 RepID=A0ABV0Q906_9TELE
MGLLTVESSMNGLVCVFHSVGEIHRVLRTPVVLGEQVVQKTRLKMDRLVSRTEAIHGNVIQATMEVLVMTEVSSQEKLHVRDQMVLVGCSGWFTKKLSIMLRRRLDVTSAASRMRLIAFDELHLQGGDTPRQQLTTGSPLVENLQN